MAKASDNQFPKVLLTPLDPSTITAPSGTEAVLLDSTDGNKLKRKNSSGTLTVIEGGSSGSAESYDAAMTAIGSIVHRWKFEETSGATIADSVGSLTLTLSGTAGTNYNRNITGPTGLGLATNFVNAHADSASIGSIPVGSADRTVVFIFRTSSQAQQVPFSYGTAAAYQMFYPEFNVNGITNQIGAFTPEVGGGSDLMALTNVPQSDGAWHFGAMGLRGSGKNRFGYIDAIYGQGSFTTAANTVSTGLFRVGQLPDNTLPLIGDLADLAVFSRALSRGELDRLFRAAAL